MEGKNNFDSTRLAEFERKGRKYEFDSFFIIGILDHFRHFRSPNPAGYDVFLDFFRRVVKFLAFVGGSFNGRTTGSGPVNQGSNPCPPAILIHIHGRPRACLP